MSSVCHASNPPRAEESRQRILQIVADSAGRIGHDLLGLTVPLRAVLEAVADDGVDVTPAPQACRLIEGFAATLQMLGASGRMSATADVAAVYDTIQPLLKATLPRGVELIAEFDDPQPTIRTGRETIAQMLFRCCHAVAATATAGDRLLVECRPSVEAGAVDLLFTLQNPPSGGGEPVPARDGAELLPRHDDPQIVALGATLEVRAGARGPVIALTIPVAR